MDIMIRLRNARRIAWVLVTAISVPYLSAAAVAAPKEIAPVRSVVLFPMESGQAVANPGIAGELTQQLGDALSTSHGYRVVQYSDRLPSVQRLVALQPDKKRLASGPFSTDEASVTRAVTLGKAMLADIMIVGTVQKYVFDEKTGTADVTVALEVLDGTTGKSTQSVTVTGRGVSKPGMTEGVSERLIRQDAEKDAIRKLMKAVTGEEYLEPVQAQTPVIAAKKSNNKSWIPMLLISLGVGLLLGGSGRSSGGGGGTGGTDVPPDPPL